MNDTREQEGWRPLAPLVIPGVLALALLGRLVAGFWARNGYGADLEWMEGGMLVHAWRVQHGLPLYVAPSAEWVPYLYPPGYPWLLAALSAVVELHYPLGRAVSLGGSLLAAGSLALIVGRHGAGSPRWRGAMGLLSAAVFLGTWRYSGTFFDLVRPDGLALGLLALALLLGFERGRWAVVMSGLVLALAFTVKQHSALWGLPLLLGIARRDGWRSGGVFVMASLGPAVVFVLGMQLGTGGVFWQYVVEVPRSHPAVAARGFPGTLWELGAALPFAAPVAGAGLLLRAWATGTHRRALWLGCGLVLGATALLGEVTLPWVVSVVGEPLGLGPFKVRGLLTSSELNSMAGVFGVLGGAVGALWLLRGLRWRPVLGLGAAAVAVVVTGLMRSHQGGFLNVGMPLHWVVALGCGAVLAALGGRARGRWLAGAVLAGQLLWALGSTPWSEFTPDPAGAEEAERLAEALSHCPEPVLSPVDPWLAVRAGRAPAFHQIALWDVDHKRGPWPDSAALVREASRGHRWSCVVDGSKSVGFGLPRHYEPDPFVAPSATTLRPRVGWGNRPYALLRPKVD